MDGKWSHTNCLHKYTQHYSYQPPLLLFISHLFSIIHSIWFLFSISIEQNDTNSKIQFSHLTEWLLKTLHTFHQKKKAKQMYTKSKTKLRHHHIYSPFLVTCCWHFFHLFIENYLCHASFIFFKWMPAIRVHYFPFQLQWRSFYIDIFFKKAYFHWHFEISLSSIFQAHFSAKRALHCVFNVETK